MIFSENRYPLFRIMLWRFIVASWRFGQELEAYRGTRCSVRARRCDPFAGSCFVAAKA
jgi:hypothetical protein